MRTSKSLLVVISSKAWLRELPKLSHVSKGKATDGTLLDDTSSLLTTLQSTTESAAAGEPGFDVSLPNLSKLVESVSRMQSEQSSSDYSSVTLLLCTPSAAVKSTLQKRCNEVLAFVLRFSAVTLPPNTSFKVVHNSELRQVATVALASVSSVRSSDGAVESGEAPQNHVSILLSGNSLDATSPLKSTLDRSAENCASLSFGDFQSQTSAKAVETGTCELSEVLLSLTRVSADFRTHSAVHSDMGSKKSAPVKVATVCVFDFDCVKCAQPMAVSTEPVAVSSVETESLTPATAKRLAKAARKQSNILRNLSKAQRDKILEAMGDSLLSNSGAILAANKRDLDWAAANGVDSNLRERLSLCTAKLQTVAKGILSLTALRDPIYECKLHTELSGASDGRGALVLKKETVPLGVLLIVFESRPDCVPQIMSLAVGSGNGLLLKGGKEAKHSNAVLYKLLADAISQGSDGAVNGRQLVSLFTLRSDVSTLCSLSTRFVDLIIPRGSARMVSSITALATASGIPVLAHADGVCHVYLDSALPFDADIVKVMRVLVDAKLEYAAACNAAETLLIHHSHFADHSLFGKELVNRLRLAGVQVFGGPKLCEQMPEIRPMQASFHNEYGSNGLTIEIVAGLSAAVAHINEHGSAHTEAILTANAETARLFQDNVDSACVFHNASTRFADGFRFGFGAEVGISTSKIHARGPVGVGGLLTTRFTLKGDGHTAAEFKRGALHYSHKSLSTATH